jgi:hydroxymethylpyrimidine/phosphomethylpyrimidine kinase
MGNVVPDRFFWAMPPGDEEDGEAADDGNPPETPVAAELPGGPKGPRQMH